MATGWVSGYAHRSVRVCVCVCVCVCVWACVGVCAYAYVHTKQDASCPFPRENLLPLFPAPVFLQVDGDKGGNSSHRPPEKSRLLRQEEMDRALVSLTLIPT